MSSGSGQVVAYLQRQLSQNPVHQSPEIIALRAKAFRLRRSTATAAATVSSSAEQRSHLRDQLEAIRSQCFTAPVEQLQQQLAGLSLSAYPDLEALAKRLQVIVRCRTKLPQLTTDRRFNGDFFACLKKVLTQPARDVAVLREQVLSSFRRKGRLRRRGQAMIRLLKEQVPELYALEADWLESLLQVRSHYSSFSLATSGENSGNTAIGAGLVIVLVTGLILFLAVPRSERDRSRPTRYPVNAAPATPPEYPKTYPPDSFVERFEPEGDRARRREAERRRIAESRREAERRAEAFQREAERKFEEFRRRHANFDEAFSDLPENFPQPRFAPMPGEPGESISPAP